MNSRCERDGEFAHPPAQVSKKMRLIDFSFFEYFMMNYGSDRGGCKKPNAELRGTRLD